MANLLSDEGATGDTRSVVSFGLWQATVNKVADRRSLLSWGVVALIVAVVFGTPALAFAGYEKFPFDSSITEMVAEENPSYVFIGNSMVDSRIDPEHLSTITNGKKALVLADGGDMSAIWYLRLKNQVIKSGVKPEAVFIFFRNDNLTKPVQNVTGNSRLKIQRFSTDTEPVVEEVFSRNLSLREKIRDKLDDLYPISTYRGYAGQTIARMSASPQFPDFFRLSLLRLIKPATKAQPEYVAQMENFARLKTQTNEHLGYSNIRNTLLTIHHPVPPPAFDDVVETSFLPHIIALGDESGIPLVFVRVQQYGTSVGAVAPSLAMERYLSNLGDYLEANGAQYYDLNGDPAITPDFYSDGDHIHPDMMKAYTEIFRDRLAAAFASSETNESVRRPVAP